MSNKRITTGIPSPMSQDFHDWLSTCPVNWYREKVTDIDVHYSFDIETNDIDDN